MRDVAQEKILAARDLPRATGRTAARSTSTAASTARRPNSSGRSARTSWSSGPRCASRATTWPARSGSSRPSPTRATSTASTTACRRSRATGWSGSRPCPSTSPSRSCDEIEAGGIPVIMLRGEGQMNPDGVRDYDLLVPATAEALVRAARCGARRERSRRPTRGGSAYVADPDAAAPPREGAAAARRRAPRSASRARSSGRSGRAWSILLGVGPDDDEPRPRTSRAGSPSCGSSATTRAGRTESLTRRRRRRAGRSPVHAVRRHAPRAPAGVHGRRAAGARGDALPAVRRRAARART